MEGGETYIEPDLNIFRGTVALSSKYFSHATKTIVMTPANTNDQIKAFRMSAYILETALTMITALSHGFLFPPHCRASETYVTAPAPNMAPIKSKAFVCCRLSRGVRFVGSDLRGGDALSRRTTAVREMPPMGRLMKKHQR